MSLTASDREFLASHFARINAKLDVQSALAQFLLRSLSPSVLRDPTLPVVAPTALERLTGVTLATEERTSWGGP